MSALFYKKESAHALLGTTGYSVTCEGNKIRIQSLYRLFHIYVLLFGKQEILLYNPPKDIYINHSQFYWTYQ